MSSGKRGELPRKLPGKKHSTDEEKQYAGVFSIIDHGKSFVVDKGTEAGKTSTSVENAKRKVATYTVLSDLSSSVHALNLDSGGVPPAGVTKRSVSANPTAFSTSVDPKDHGDDKSSSDECYFDCSETTMETGKSTEKNVDKGACAAVSYDTTTKESIDDEQEENREKDDSPEQEQRPIKTCISCYKKSQDMKTCSACKYAAYCDRNCQKKDWKIHKKNCANYRRFSYQVKVLDSLEFILKHGQLKKGVSLEGVPYESRRDGFVVPREARECLVLEIIGLRSSFCRAGCFVQDVHGKQSFIMFHHNTPASMIFTELPSESHDLDGKLIPGRYICLIEPRLHYFMDGTIGFRIDHKDEFELL